MNFENIQTEESNPNTRNIDALSTIEMVRLMNKEDEKVAGAVKKALPEIAAAIDIIAEHMRQGGRLIYIGCGTSGRLGVLDAAECPPTFSTEPGQVIGLIAGGESAMFVAVEGAEDNPELGKKDLEGISLTKSDVLVGIAASGRTPYVIGALQYAHSIGASTVSLCCSPGSDLTKNADIPIVVCPGPEVITGSTRLKSGTAQKMVLNMLSTCTMIKLGKVYGNLMVDVRPSNNKLVHRCERIVSTATGVDENKAKQLLVKCNYRPKIAIVMAMLNISAQDAERLLKEHEGRISQIITSSKG